jgi:integrase
MWTSKERPFAFAKRSMKATIPLQRHKAATETFRSGRHLSKHFATISGVAELQMIQFFPSRNGTYLRPGNLHKRWLLPACAKAKLRRFSWHDFRRTHATLLSDMGEPLKTAQAQLGHASLSTTAEIYAQAVPASQRAAVDRLEKAVGFLEVPNGPKIERVIHPGSSLIQ